MIFQAKGYLQLPDGQKVELFYNNVIANILFFPQKDIRKWELLGYIPLSPFCDKFGRRMYTKDMIRCISQCAEQYKIYKRKPNLYNSAFFKIIAVRLERLYAQYKARLEMPMLEKYKEHNKKILREIVVNSDFYKNYMREKEIRANEVREKRRKASRKFWEIVRRVQERRKARKAGEQNNGGA